MLILPESGFQPSKKKHNVRLDALVDWIEASVHFVDEELSQTDVADCLIENLVYEDQDFALERIADAWSELRRRMGVMGDGAVAEVVDRKLVRVAEWSSCPTYAFCLLLTVQVNFRRWASQFGADYTEQGALFEEITAECLKELGWDVYRTGWSPGNTATIRQVLDGVSEHIGEEQLPGELLKWISESANEEQLDVVCCNPFYDGWGGRPLFFFQCASGRNWTEKLTTPDPDTWRRVISFTTIPQRGFAMPFALLKEDFQRRAGKVRGIFLDRFRLQAPALEGNLDWSSSSLSKRLTKWMTPRIRALPSVIA